MTEQLNNNIFLLIIMLSHHSAVLMGLLRMSEKNAYPSCPASEGAWLPSECIRQLSIWKIMEEMPKYRGRKTHIAQK